MHVDWAPAVVRRAANFDRPGPHSQNCLSKFLARLARVIDRPQPSVCNALEAKVNLSGLALPLLPARLFLKKHVLPSHDSGGVCSQSR